MRIEDRYLSGSLATQTGRSTETQSIQGDEAHRAGAARGQGNDRAEVSSLAGRITSALENAAVQRSTRVAELAKLVQTGAYRPNSQAAGQAIVAQALAGSLGATAG
jgi:hypothetical protein